MTESNTVKARKRLSGKLLEIREDFIPTRLQVQAYRSEDYKVVFYDEILRSGLAQ